MTSAPITPPERDTSVSGELTPISGVEASFQKSQGEVSSSVSQPPRTVNRRSTKLGKSFESGPNANGTEISNVNEEPEGTTSAVPDSESGSQSASNDSALNQSETDNATAQRNMPVLSADRARERGRVATQNPVVLQVNALSKQYGGLLAASDIRFQVHAGSFTGVVGPNGAGKTTVLSMVSGLNRPSSGTVTVNGIDVWSDGPSAKRVIGSLPDRLRLFDRLTGSQLMYYFGVLHGLKEETVAARANELAVAFGLESALDRVVSDYSSGMQKKIGLACAMIHAPEILVLDEPFETIDPVSAATVTEILEKFVAGGGSVVMSSHSLELIQRVCDHVVVIANGHIVANGSVDSVRAGLSLEERFSALTQSASTEKGLEWLRASGNFA